MTAGTIESSSRPVDPYSVTTFEEFWPFYVRLHTKPETHWMHALATTASAASIALAVSRRNPLYLLLGPLANHLFAQTSHRLFEKNHSTPWKNTAWHTRAELRMLRLVLTGKMNREVARHTA